MQANRWCGCASESSTLFAAPSSRAVHAPGRQAHIARLMRGALDAAGFALALLLPKCPLCVAAWAAAAGIGAAGRHFLMQAADPRVRPVVLLVLVLPFSLQLTFGARARLLRRRSHGATRKLATERHLGSAIPANGTHSNASGD